MDTYTQTHTHTHNNNLKINKNKLHTTHYTYTHTHTHTNEIIIIKKPTLIIKKSRKYNSSKTCMTKFTITPKQCFALSEVRISVK